MINGRVTHASQRLIWYVSISEESMGEGWEILKRNDRYAENEKIVKIFEREAVVYRRVCRSRFATYIT